MSDSFHHHSPDTGAAGHHTHTDVGVTHHTSHSSSHHDDAAATASGRGLDDHVTPAYGSPPDVTAPDWRRDRYDARTMVTVRPRSVPAAISIFFLVFFVAVAAIIALGVHAVFSESDSDPSISVPSNWPAAPDQP